SLSLQPQLTQRSGLQ
nr:thromboxane A2 receptor isoform alpha {C-terminal} [human, blood platelets, Peptide Partial, 15 aa] [Homo sapiens]